MKEQQYNFELRDLGKQNPTLDHLQLMNLLADRNPGKYKRYKLLESDSNPSWGKQIVEDTEESLAPNPTVAKVLPDLKHHQSPAKEDRLEETDNRK